MSMNRLIPGVALSAVAALALAGCGANAQNASDTQASSATVTVTDNKGEQTVPAPPHDRRCAWNVPIATASSARSTTPSGGFEMAVAHKTRAARERLNNNASRAILATVAIVEVWVRYGA